MINHSNTVCTLIKLNTMTHLIIQITMNRHFWLCLPFEKSIMQLLIIDVDLSHFRSHTFTHFGFQCLLILFLLEGLSHLHNTSGLDKLWQIKWRLFYASFPLQILAFKAPVPWYSYCVSCCLQQCIFTQQYTIEIKCYNNMLTFTLRMKKTWHFLALSLTSFVLL